MYIRVYMPLSGLEPTIPRCKTIPSSDRKVTEIVTVLYKTYDACFSVIFSVIVLFDYFCYQTPRSRSEAQSIFMTSVVIIIHS
jgi:hypothetical protein